MTKAKEQKLTNAVSNAQNDKGYSALHLAVQKNHEEVVDELLRSKVDVNTSSNKRSNIEPSTENGYYYNGIIEGRTPLMEASFIGNLSVVRKLVAHKGSIDAVNKNNSNAVTFAAQSGHNDVLKHLLKNKRMLAEHKGHQNRTPLGFASMYGRLNVVKELIQNFRVDINTQDQFLRTPLILAAKYNHPSVVDFLSKQGADLSIKDIDGKDAMDRAMENKNQEIINLLRNHCP